MKRFTRMLIFPASAIFLTSLWNGGFAVNFTPQVFVKTVILLSIFYYLVVPITKLVLLPVNILTLGFVSSIVYFLLFYLFITRFSLISIKPWDFQGLSLANILIPKIHIGYFTNLLLTSFSLSFLIQLQENLV